MATYRVELSNANVEVELDDPNPITGNNDPQLAASQVVNDSSVSGSTVKDSLDWLLGNTSITVHNDLTGLQGGSSDQYYHMTTAEHTSATRDATNAINGLMPAGKMSNWDAAFSHVSMSGADHTFIDQDVTIASTPQFAGATFTAFPLTPSSSPVNDYDVANKKYVDDNAGGGSHLPNVDYLIWNVLATPPAAVEGQVQWDTELSTILVTSDKGSANSVGYEDWDRVYNLTGADVTNGQPVALNGDITANLRECFLAEADATGSDVNRRNVLGIATHTFASGSDGIVTSRGRVRDIDTSGTGSPNFETWSAGDELWLSTIRGELTNVKPLLPSSQIRMGEVVVAHATAGIIDVAVKDLSWVGHTQSGDSALERTGFVLKDGVAVDLADSPITLSIDDVAQELTITSTNGFAFYSVNNLLIKAPGDHASAWTDVEGDHFFWFDETGTLVHSTSFDDRVILGPWVFVAYLYWDADNSRTILSGPLQETHGLQMDGATHFHFHNTLGAQVLGSGLALGSLVVDGDGSAAADAQFSVDSGVITDEDLRFAISAITSTAGLPILYLDGAMEYVREIEQTGFSVVTDTTAGVGATGRLVYNEWTGTVWQLTTVPVNDYVLCHVFAVGSGGVGDKVYAAVGQDVYATATAAKEGATVEMGNLAVKLPFAEVRPIASVIFQTGSYGNAVDARIRPSLDGDYVDWRSDAIPGGSGFTASSHNSLSDRSAANSHPVEAISAAGTSYGIIADDGLGALGSTAWLINGTNMAAPSGGQISNVTDPTLDQDVATKAYVDSLISTDHNSLTGLQGGDTNEYYHLTSAQHVGLVGLTNQYQIPVVGASAGVLSESTWSINASTMTGPAASIISAATSLTLTSGVVVDGSLASPGIEFTAPTELTISGGNITSTQALHLVDTENDDAADDLNSIIASGYAGIIYVRPVSAARVVTLKHGTGNLELGGSDVVMDSLDKWIALTYDSGISKWLIAGGTSTGGGGTSVHNDLTGLQGGTTAEYYHMTSAENTAATRDATNSVNGLMPTGKLTNWDAASTHVSSDGTDHTFIDQDVRTTASPQFAGGTFTAFPVTPSQAPTTDYQVANKKYVDDNASASPLTTKGDLLAYSTVDTRLPIGTSDYVLTVDANEATGMKWAPVTGGGSSVLYDSGVLTTAVTSLAIPDSVMAGRTAADILMEVPGAGAATTYYRLFVNNDTNTSNYGYTQMGTAGSTPYGTGTNAGSDVMQSNVQSGSNEHAMGTVHLRVVGDQLWWTSDTITSNNSTTRQKDNKGGHKHTGTISDLSGMSLVASQTNGFVIGSRVRIVDPTLAGGSGLHNDLTSIQGGTTAEYYHLTSAQHTAATRDATNVVNGLMPSGKLTNWDAAFTHVSSTGADHSYLDQAVTVASAPQFAGATFTVFPTTPSSAPTTDYQVANKKYVDDNAGGSPLTTKGDLFTYSTVDARLPIGTNDYVLTADSSEATGMKWAAAGGGGTKAHAYLTMSASQTTDLTSGDPVQFDQRDGTIGFASGTYRVTLLQDVKYELEFAVSPLFSSSAGALDIQVYDVTNAAYLSTDISSINRINATSSSSNIPDNIMGKGVITPATNIDIEFRISGVGNITQITGFGLSWAMIKEL